LGTYLHETQPEAMHGIEEHGYVNPNLAELQRIESGGTKVKAELGSMPQPIRYFGYFFFTSAVLMLVIGLVVQFLK
jgi:hypothetical protein